jgi:hypothetical protein
MRNQWTYRYQDIRKDNRARKILAVRDGQRPAEHEPRSEKQVLASGVALPIKTFSKHRRRHTESTNHKKKHITHEKK